MIMVVDLEQLWSAYFSSVKECQEQIEQEMVSMLERYIGGREVIHAGVLINQRNDTQEVISLPTSCEHDYLTSE